MAEPEIALLREISEEQKAQRTILDEHSRKLDKLSAEIARLGDSVHRAEEALEAMVNILQRNGLV